MKSMNKVCQVFITKLKALDPAKMDNELTDAIEDLIAPLEKAGDIEPVLPAIFEFFEKYPLADHGMPGPMVHKVETLPEKSYEPLLIKSVLRRPTPHTLWMINRILNANPPNNRKKLLLSAMRGALKHPLAEDETKDAARVFSKNNQPNNGIHAEPDGSRPEPEISMVIDIRDEVPDFLDYIRRRVAQQLAISKKQKKPEPVSQIDFGFEFGQGNELWLVFDTRLDAKPDGEWTLQVGKIPALKRPKWPIWHRLPEGAQVFFIDLKGKKVNVMKDPDNLICNIVGEAMKHALLAAREEGVFEPLPKARKCEMGVENMEGFYGWPAYKDRGKKNLV
jgi:hypothetical protein